ncbi:unnamed protein product [marine sediment metagenome]|uniref:Xaa-Pro dipeptidyl-peptidase-like domain-containing protein n=1 Tax=marine sediment metagenome TaxID=412755 RepID=X0YZ15_9ZZZZ
MGEAAVKHEVHDVSRTPMMDGQTQEITFTSDGLALQGILHRPDSSPSSAVAVCHPHPLYGGDMHNSVVVALCRAAASRGIAALRFNFRGVGRSEGSFADGVGSGRTRPPPSPTSINCRTSTTAGWGLSAIPLGLR